MKKPYLILPLTLLLSPTLNAQSCATNMPASTPTSKFTINANGTITDKQTGLMWKQCSEGQSGTNCITGSLIAYTWQDALQRAQTVNSGGGFAGYSNWRLPNLKELFSITEDKCSNPSINAVLFPNTPSSSYWTSSPALSNLAWVTGFIHPGGFMDTKSSQHYVRLVRNDQ